MPRGIFSRMERRKGVLLGTPSRLHDGEWRRWESNPSSLLARQTRPLGTCVPDAETVQQKLTKRKGQDSNLQGLTPRPLSKRVPSCLLARPSVGAVAREGIEPSRPVGTGLSTRRVYHSTTWLQILLRPGKWQGGSQRQRTF